MMDAEGARHHGHGDRLDHGEGPGGMFLNVTTLAQALGVTPSTVHEWTRRIGPQSVPRYKVGRGYKFLLAEVVEWIKATRDARADRGGRRPRRVLATGRRAPDKQTGGRQAKKPCRTRVSGDGPAAVALGVPSDG